MKLHPIPYFTIAICISTLVVSFYVVYNISGSLFGKINIVQLEPYGGIRFNHLRDLEIWRLFASQIIHVKPYHMLYNVFAFAVLGSLIERKIGFFRTLLLWFIAGAIATLFGTLFVKFPWNLGTGASQAILGFAGFGCIIIKKKVDRSLIFKFAVGFAVVPALALDLFFVHYPQPGHVLGFILGLVIAQFYLRPFNKDSLSSDHT